MSEKDGEEMYGPAHKDESEAIFEGIPSFLGLPTTESLDELEAEDPDVAVLGAPLDTATTGRPGTRYGPRAIRAAKMMPSPPYEHFNIETGVDPFDTLKVVDTGDASMTPGDTRASHKTLEQSVKEISKRGICPFVLGGDHSITHQDVKGWAEARDYDNIGMIHFDCHADTDDSGVTGFEYDHGAHIKRIVDLGILDGDNYTLIGPRGYWPGPDTFEAMRDAGMKWYTSQEVAGGDLTKIADDALERARDGTDAVWMTFDVDTMEPAICPGTGVPEPFGLLPREVAVMIRHISKQLDVEDFGFDIVEVAPQYDAGDGNSYNGGITAVFANRICIEVLGGLALNKRGLKEGSPIKPKESKQQETATDD